MQAEQTVKKNRRFISFYTKGEEIFNAVSHIAAGGLGIIAWIILLIFSDDALDAVSVSVFGLSIVILYTMSALYHFLPNSVAKGVFRIFDHCTIYLLIAGSYTPVCLVALRGTAWGYGILIAQWTLAIAGIVMNAIAMNNKLIKGISMSLYIIMGWMAIFFIKWIFPYFEAVSFAFLLAGGIAYSAGIAFYAFDKKVKYFHAVWHLFVLLGTILQFVSILLMLI